MSEENKPLDKMTVKELREVAKEIPEITGATAMKKDELLAAIKKAKGIEDEKPAPKKAVSKSKAAVSVAEIKAKMTELRRRKESLKGQADRKTLSVLRRRINRLRKRSRVAARA